MHSFSLLKMPFRLTFLTGLMLCLAAGCQAAVPAAITPPALPALVTPAQNLAAYIQSTNTPTALPTQAETATLQPTATLIPTPPPSHLITAIKGHHQFFPLGCEAAAAKDWANYYGQDFNEFEFQFKLPVSDNPDLGFVGSVYSPWGQVPPYGYGVYPGPVADLLNTYSIPARAYKGMTLDQLKQKIAQDQPVIVWVIGNVVSGVPSTYTDSRGSKVLVAAYEHVVIVTGYTETHIRYMNNGKFYDTPNQVFLNSWGVLGFMAITRQ